MPHAVRLYIRRLQSSPRAPHSSVGLSAPSEVLGSYRLREDPRASNKNNNKESMREKAREEGVSGV